MLFGCCQSNPQKPKTGDIIEIDILKTYPKIRAIKPDMVDMEFVPLETGKDVLVEYDKAYIHYVSEKYMIVIVYGRWEMFVFDRSGKIVTLISRKGRGPGEYTGMIDVVFDERNEELFVFDNIGTGRIVVYSLTGEYRRTLKYSADLELTQAYEFDEETMLVYDTKGLYKNNYSVKPYMFMSKKDGKITSTVNIHLPMRYSTKVYDQFTDSSGQLLTYSSSLAFPYRRQFGQDFVISDISADTIYRLTQNRDLIPLMVRKPSVHSTDPHLICTSEFITDKYIFLYITTLDYASIQKEKAPPATTLMYEFETGKITTVEHIHFGNDLKILQKNMDAHLLDVTVLKNAYENNKLKGELKQLVATLGDEDNPVVMIMKYK
jgi:hypothetical protein